MGWQEEGDSGSMATSGVMVSTSRISIEDDGDARVSFSGERLTGDEELRPVARR
jgi:hypothetical protein